MKKYIIALIAVLLPLFINAQQKSIKSKNLTSNHLDTPRNLNVGEIVPDIFIEKIVNDNNTRARTSNYKNGLLILDFWTTGCTACILAFPKMDSIQKIFGTKIKILAVTYEAESHVKTFFKNNKYGRSTMLPSVVEDKVLNKWFKHWAIPHEVWIYKGKVIALTGGEYVTTKNIQYVLDGNEPKWPVKNDFQEIDYSKPLFKTQAGQAISYTAIMPFKEGVRDKKIVSLLDSVNKIRRNYFLNLAIIPAYKILWRQLGVPSEVGTNLPNRLILNVKDRSKYIYDSGYGALEEWNRKNEFCYESVYPDTSNNPKEHFRLIIEDLNRFLGLEARWEKQLKKCLILTKTSKKDNIASKGGESFSVLDKKVKQFRNVPLGNLVYALNNYEKNPPVFDETGYKLPVDLDLEIESLTDIQSIRKALLKYDLDFKEEEREIYMFVVTENELSKL